MVLTVAKTVNERLEVCGIALRTGKAIARLAACSSANRPASRSSLVNFVGRTQTFKAHVLDACEVAEFLLDKSFPNQEILQQAKDILKACSLDPTERVNLDDHPDAQRRILRAAKCKKISEMSLRSLAEWILAQSHIDILASSPALVQTLFATGYVKENANGGLIYNLSLEPIALDAHLFQERRALPPIEMPKRKARDNIFEMHPPSQEVTASTSSTALAGLNSFDDLCLNETLIQSLQHRGLREPSEIQQHCLPPLLQGQDVLAQARSGTGKTVSFAIAALQRIDYSLCGSEHEPRCPAGHYFKKVFAHKACQVWEGCRCAGCISAGIPVDSFEAGDQRMPRQGNGCTVCGCSSERDCCGDRICWCDSCWYGCIPQSNEERIDTNGFDDLEDENCGGESEQGVYCKKCAWYLCKTCYVRAGSSLMRRIFIPRCQVLVVVPTRELANQIQQEFSGLGWRLGVRCHACIGGSSVRADIDALRKGQHVVVGNPGRLFDMISKRHLRVENIKLFVMDEADAILSGSFKDQIYDIFKCLPPQMQIGVFSTALPPEIVELTTKFLRDPVHILTQDHMLMPSRARHFYMYMVGGQENKVNRLCGLWGLITRAPGAMIFIQSRRMVDFVAEQLANAGLNASTLHADLDQKERDLVMQTFRTRSSKVLICTNDFGRGLNVPHVRLVVNFNMPSAEDYLVRSGRCGRFGRSGVVITLVAKEEISAVRLVAHRYHMHIDETSMETLAEIKSALRGRIDSENVTPASKARM